MGEGGREGASLEIESFTDETQRVSHLKSGRMFQIWEVACVTPPTQKKDLCVQRSENRFEWLKGSNESHG